MNANDWSVAGKSVKVGDIYGRLTIIGIYHDRRIMLKCQCTCGTLFRAQARHVVSGATTSCGCFAAEQSKNRNSILRRKPLGWASFVNLYCLYRCDAKKRGLIFDLNKDQFKKLTESNCHYCGAPPAQKHCAGYGAYRCNGVDRINNNEGYTAENTVPCCYFCNRAKGTRSIKEFKAWLLNTAKFVLLGQKPDAPQTRIRYFKSHADRKTTALKIST